MRFRNVAPIVLAITVARLAYNAWLSPYELLADEAQYWDWSRHLDWSYYSKGPGIAWLIAATTGALGNAEWAIRAPAAVAFAVVMLALAYLTHELSATSGRSQAAMLVPVIVLLVPIYQLSALLMTIDAPYLACWAVGLCAGWRAWQLERQSTPSVGPWIVLGLAIGVGFLFKYTALFLIPGFLLFAWVDRHGLQRPDWWRRGLWAGVVVAVTAAPVALWNLRHQAAGVSHLLGYLRLPGGDRPSVQMRSPLATALEYPIGQLAAIGPILVLAWIGVRALNASSGDRERRAVRFALCMSLPMLALFLAASWRTRIEVNWPMAAFLSLIPLAAFAAVDHQNRWWWRVAVAYGVASLIATHSLLLVARAPIVGNLVPVHRFSGSRARASSLADCVNNFVVRTQGRGVIVAPGHNEAGLLAYYLPGQPSVASAGLLLGNRPSAYDFFPETDLRGAALARRPWLLVFSGGCAERTPPD